MELSYSLPKSLLTRTPFSQVRLTLSGYNLLTFTGIKDADPEMVSNGEYIGYSTPQSKTYNFGVNLTF